MQAGVLTVCELLVSRFHRGVRLWLAERGVTEVPRRELGLDPSETVRDSRLGEVQFVGRQILR